MRHRQFFRLIQYSSIRYYCGIMGQGHMCLYDADHNLITEHGGRRKCSDCEVYKLFKNK